MKINKLLIIKLIILIITVFSNTYLLFKLFDLKIIPNKYLLIISIVSIVINLINILFSLLKNKILNILSVLLSIIIIFVSCFAIKHVNNVSDFINKAFNNNSVEVTEYSAVVLNSSDINSLEELENKKLGYITFDENKSEVINKINVNNSLVLKEYEDPQSLYEDLLKKKIDSFVISEGFLEVIEEEYKDLNDNIKVIFNFDIEVNMENFTKEVNELKPVNILISGSDSRSGKILSKTRSDVNMIMTIDAKNHKILLTSIPRDYYVQLHGTKGNKDKLTHAGIYGINMTKSTIEDVFDIKIDYTIKVGFQSVIQIVDTIGGIDIESDKTFRSHCGDGGAKITNVVEGMNHFDGGQALSYARERYAYKTGDNHRTQNQQQVLEAIIDKLSNDKSILKKYDEVLKSFKELYRTDIPSSYIRLLVNDQLNSMSPWTIEKQQVSGSGVMLHTYSMPSVKLWVMIPDNNSVKNAKEKINEYLNN